MDYQVTMLTVSQVIPSGSSGNARYAPWYNQYSSISLSNPTLSTITITDDDPVLNSRYYSPGETQQFLAEDTTFGYGAGAQTVVAGTKISNFTASLIRDQDGNEFHALFPRDFNGSIGTELGGRYSVLIMPVERIDPVTGESSYPSFDPNASFGYVRTVPLQSGDAGAPSYAPSAAVPCFASGTMIDTMFGPRAIDSLSVGDMIRTRDNGMRWLSWIGSTYLDAGTLDQQPNLRPIRIRAGALAQGVPTRNLIVSPQHRILVRSSIARRLFGEEEILVAAKHLVGLPGIEVMRPDHGVTYWHMLFDGHEVVSSDGAWSESLFVGPQAMEAVGPDARNEIFALFPQMSQPGFQAIGARRLLSGREGRDLAQRHARHARHLVEAI